MLSEPPRFLDSFSPALLPQSQSRTASWWKQLAQVVFSLPAGPARTDFDHEDSVAIVQGLAQGIFQLLRGEHSTGCPDGMHQRDGSELAQLLVELGVAVMCEHLANENVKLLLHGADSNQKANKKRIQNGSSV